MFTLWLYFLLFTVRVRLPDSPLVRFEQTSDQKTWKTSIISLAPLRPNVLTIIYCALKLSCELLKHSEAMKAIFKNTHKGGKSTRSKEVV